MIFCGYVTLQIFFKKKDIIKYQCFSADWINDCHAMNCFTFEMTKQWLFFSSVFVFNFYFKLNYEGIINTEFFFPQLIIIYPLLGIKNKKKKKMSCYFQTSNPAASFKKLQTHIYTPAEILTLCPHAQTVGCGNVDDWSPSLSQSC